ncbi:unnamed protein product, partial [Laminaria digitata]
SSWRCLLVIKRNSLCTGEQPGDVCRDQAPQCPLVNGLRCLLVSKTMFAHDQMQLNVCWR